MVGVKRGENMGKLKALWEETKEFVDKREKEIAIFVYWKKGIEHRRKLAKRIYRKLFGVGASVDVIIETPDEFNELKDKWFLVYSEIAKFGREIYEK